MFILFSFHNTEGQGKRAFEMSVEVANLQCEPQRFISIRGLEIRLLSINSSLCQAVEVAKYPAPGKAGGLPWWFSG